MESLFDLFFKAGISGLMLAYGYLVFSIVKILKNFR